MKALSFLFFISFFASAYRSGSTSVDWSYYPEKSKPEDNWQAAVAVSFTSNRKHFSELELKSGSIIVYDKSNAILYDEKIFLNIAVPMVAIEWKSEDFIGTSENLVGSS